MADTSGPGIAPVCMLVFNRPETTAAVFETVAAARPEKLFLVADGARADNADDASRCQQVRDIVTRVSWPCEVHQNFSPINLGLRERVVSGLDWLFSHVESAIILEDDCAPHAGFFGFCSELLDRYADDERVMAISGNNFQGGRSRGTGSYYYSRLPHIWGWATWARAWQLYDADMATWRRLRETDVLHDALGRRDAAEYWARIFDDANIEHTWDYQWVWTCLMQGGSTILPNANLVSNLGFGTDATHTTDAASPWANMPITAPDSPLRHPVAVVPDRAADDYTLDTVFGVSRAAAAGTRAGPVRARLRSLRAELLRVRR